MKQAFIKERLEKQRIDKCCLQRRAAYLCECLVQIVRVRREQHLPPVKGNPVAHMGYLIKLLPQVLRPEGLQADVLAEPPHGVIRRVRQLHKGDVPAPQEICQFLHRLRLVLWKKQCPDRSAPHDLHCQLRRKMIRVKVGEQQAVQLFKRRFAAAHFLPAVRRQWAEGVSLPSEDAVEQERHPPVADAHACVCQQGDGNREVFHRGRFTERPRCRP